MDLTDYVKINQEDFHRIPIGTYIRWEKRSGGVSAGATITAVSWKGEVRSWVLKMAGDKTMQLRWSTDYVYIIKPLFYDYFMMQISVLSNTIKFLTETIDKRFTEEEPESIVEVYNETMAKINAKVNMLNKKSRAKILGSRKKKIKRTQSLKKIVIA